MLILINFNSRSSHWVLSLKDAHFKQDFKKLLLCACFKIESQTIWTIIKVSWTSVEDERWNGHWDNFQMKITGHDLAQNDSMNENESVHNLETILIL